MKAIQVPRPGGAEVLTLADLPIPQPKPNEIVVKITAVGINFIDVYYREGRYPAPLPFVDGSEAAGTVHAAGSDVKGWKAGDRVGYCMVLGSYAEYAAIPAERAVHVPQGVSDQQAAAALLQGMTAHYLVKSTYPLKKGETTLIHAAAGGIVRTVASTHALHGYNRSDSQRVLGDASAHQRTWRSGRESPRCDLPVVVHHVDIEPDMRVVPLHLCERPAHLHQFRRVVLRRF